MEIIGIVGAGTMGAGIAQVAVEHGHEVVIHDVDAAAIDRGRERIRDGLSRRAAKLDLDTESIDQWVEGRMAAVREAETIALLAGESDVVIEAALEDLALKQDVFRALDESTDPAVTLATNTSALSVTAIASATRHPERVIGLHFFNPVPLMTLVEVVPGSATASTVVDRATGLVASWDKTPVRSADSPGFIVNRVNRPYTIEALRLIETGEASVEAVDDAMRTAGFPMGPFELMDLAGIDINLAAARGVWDGLGRPDRLRPSPIQERLVDEGRLGRKSGSGFYRYEDGRPIGIDPAFASAGPAEPHEIRDRLLAAIDAEAIRARDEGVAAEEAIDVALRLGAAHPVGPFERIRGRTT
jgi:3-hydroxybutyryl-CoA dehydrogenase